MVVTTILFPVTLEIADALLAGDAVFTARFGMPVAEGYLDAPEVLPVMRELVAHTGESVALHVRQGDQRLCLYRVDSPQLLRDHVRAGDVLPLDRGAGGRVLMAFSGAQGKIYDKIRQDGYIHAISDRVPGLVGVSAPVWTTHHQLVGALTLTVPESRFKPQFVRALRNSARTLCQQLS